MVWKEIIIMPLLQKSISVYHEKIKPPYFKHINSKNCIGKYGELETEEHIKGKKALFEYIQKQDGVIDVILKDIYESAHQRRDIMFKYNDIIGQIKLINQNFLDFAF